jgi:hypothetical protein
MKNTASSRSAIEGTSMMRIAALAALALLLSPAAFAAESIGGQHEKITEINGRVVDLLCELTKRCAPDCGGGKRQLGLVLADGRLVAVVKGPADFGGALADIAPLCGKTVTLDGILFENPKMPLFQVQGIKTNPAARDFTPADGFLKAWEAKNGKADEWFRNDPLVKEQIAKNGVLGKPGLEPKKP